MKNRVTKIGDFDHYGDYYITEISVINNEIVLYIQPEI